MRRSEINSYMTLKTKQRLNQVAHTLLKSTAKYEVVPQVAKLTAVVQKIIRSLWFQSSYTRAEMGLGEQDDAAVAERIVSQN